MKYTYLSETYQKLQSYYKAIKLLKDFDFNHYLFDKITVSLDQTCLYSLATNSLFSPKILCFSVSVDFYSKLGAVKFHLETVISDNKKLRLYQKQLRHQPIMRNRTFFFTNDIKMR